MGSVTLSPDLEAIIGANVAVREEIIHVANEILVSAASQAPVETGALRDSGRVEVGLDHEGGTVALVIFGGGSVTYGAYVEFGTSITPVNAFLRRGAEAAGQQIG